MSSIIKYSCENCDFQFIDKNLIFYLKGVGELEKSKKELVIIEESLTIENSAEMTKSKIAGYLYISYCKHCSSYIKTYVPEDKNSNLSKEEIKELINTAIENSSKLSKNTKTEINKDNEKFTKILFLDFKNNNYKERRAILENNKCPNCNNEISLLISEKTPCPKCGNKLKESFEDK